MIPFIPQDLRHEQFYVAMNVPQSQTTQHYVAMNPLFDIPHSIPDIEQLEVQTKIQDNGQNENTPAKQKTRCFGRKIASN